MTGRWSPHPRYRLYTTIASYSPWLKSVNADSIGEFETSICRSFNVAAAVCVPMARTGLYLTLLETIQPGSKVIMSPLTIVDAVNAVLLAGGIPVFADICRESCGLDPEKAETLIDGHTSAVLITHLHGQTAGARLFRELCTRRGVRLIEDSAQAFGAIEHRRRLGTIGDAGVYSSGFFKNLSTWRGGVVVSNDVALIEAIRSRVRKFRQASRVRVLRHVLSGLIVDASTWPPAFSSLAFPVVRRNIEWFNRWLDPEACSCRLTAFPDECFERMRPWQASLGLRQLARVDDDALARLRHADRYHEGLDGVSEIVKAKRTEDLSNVYTYFTIQLRNRASLLDYARKAGRDFAPQHLRNCADLPEFRDLYRNCPNARAAATELILLPTYPSYPAIEVQRNIEAIKEWVALRDTERRTGSCPPESH